MSDEIGQILGSFKGKFAVIGGAVPWLLLGNEEMPHVGTLEDQAMRRLKVMLGGRGHDADDRSGK